MVAAINFTDLHQILHNLYEEMMPLCNDMVGISKALAGFGALLFVSSKIWQSLAKAEPIDVYPLLRPFAIGFCIMFFEVLVLGTMNGVLSPLSSGCADLRDEQMKKTEELMHQRNRAEDEAKLRDPETAYLVSDEAYDRKLENLGFPIKKFAVMMQMETERLMYSAEKRIRDWIRQALEILFQAAALAIDTLRTFFLIILSILGPLAFAFSVFEGFQSTLVQWFTRYISIYLWLPIADLFSAMLSKIQGGIFQNDIARFEDVSYIHDGSNAAYLIFMIIGIIGYFTIPSVSEWVIQAGGVGNYGKNINSTAARGAAFTGAVAGTAMGNAGGMMRKGLSSGYQYGRKKINQLRGRGQGESE